jgi:hypothetical protein
MRYSQIHHHGLFALVERRGGLATLKTQNSALAKLISVYDGLLAALELRAPRQPFVQNDEIARLVADRSLNVLPEPEHEPPPDGSSSSSSSRYSCGSSLPALQCTLGTFSPLASVLSQLSRVVAIDDAMALGIPLRNPNFLALRGEKEALHHAILSVPPHTSFVDCPLYEAVRLVTMIFDVGVVFPLPPVTGALAKLVKWVRAALESIDMEQVREDSAEALVWILFVAGVAAKGTTERAWYVEKLNALVEWLSIMRWSEIKKLLRSFVWMVDAMDEEAIDLWDDVRCYECV